MILSAVDIELSAARLRQFLVTGGVQRHKPPQDGAVAGSVAADGTIHYVYGEITGYYLHWLASLGASTGDVRVPAQAAAQWLQAYLRGTKPPLTRIYLTAAPDDWRNHALFAFDFAMIAGGLGRAAAHQLIALPAPLVASLQRWLQPFVGDAGLRACLSTDTEMQLPVRWSTQGGSFSAKTASRILLFARQAELDASLLDACHRTLAHIAQAAETNGLDMLHPTLYALEGCLLYPQADFARLARWFDQIVALQAPDGSLPESLHTPGVRRSDIIAQALRLAVFLERLLEQPGRYHAARAGFATALCARVTGEGRIAFTQEAPEANTWCALFAEQALRLQAAALRERALPFAPEDLA